MKKSNFLSLAVVGLSLSYVPVADAAFEWRAPKTKVEQIKVESAPVAPVTSTPEITWMKQDNVEETVIDVELPEPISEKTVMMPEPIEADRQNKAVDMIEVLKKPGAKYSSDASESAVMQNVDTQTSATPAYYGFGKDIPLVMAVGQIIPQDYNPVFSKHINLGQRISWSAADSWSDSLEAALNTAGLGHRIDGNTVYILNQYEARARVVDMIPQPKAVPTQPVETTGKPVQMNPVQSTQQSTKPVETAEAPKWEKAITLSNTSTENPDLPEVIQPKKAMTKKWVAGSEETLRETLQRWSDQNNSQLYWLIDYDYRLKKPVSVNGRFEEAVKSLLDQFEEVDPRPYGQLFRSANNSHVLTIKAYGVE